MRRAGRWSAVVALAAAASMTLSGCLFTVRGSADASPAPSGTSQTAPAPDTSGVTGDLLPYYSQVLAWETCGALECARVEVPRDWNAPADGAIELDIVRHRATSGAAKGVLLTNPGGPGASGVGFVQSGLSTLARGPLQADFDIIGFDPRGVGRSAPVSCGADEELDGYYFDPLPGTRGSAERDAALEASNERFARTCGAESNGMLPFISTDFAARDMDVLRAVLGQTSLDYLGYSYGTFLGATYAGLYPERVGRMVLDGGIDPTTSSMDVSVEQGIGFEQSLRAFVEDCLAQADCPFSGGVDDAMRQVGALLASVDAEPLVGSDGRELTADTLLTAIVYAQYSPSSWPTLRSALRNVQEGVAWPAMMLADLYLNRVGGQYVTNQMEAFRAYNCMDYAPISEAEAAAGEARLRAEAPTIAPFWVGPDPCQDWPVQSTTVRAPITAEGAAPILVVGSTGDPATPYEWSVALADQLVSGVLVTRDGEGHTGYNKGDSCVDAALEAYLLQGDVPAGDLVCS